MPGGMREKEDRPVVRISIGVITAVILLVVVSSFFYHLNGDSNDYSRSELLIVPTGSMDGGPRDYEIPTIPKDSMIISKHLTDEERDQLKVGDVVTFYQYGIYKVHRIVYIDGDSIVTRGDASRSTDDPITKDDVVGKVVGVSVIVGDVISTVRDMIRNQGLLIFIGLIILIIMIYEIRVVISIMKEDDESVNC